MSDDAFKGAVLAPTPAPYDPNATHTLVEKIAHVAELAFEAVVETAKDVLHVSDTDWKGEGYNPEGTTEPETEVYGGTNGFNDPVVEDADADAAEPEVAKEAEPVVEEVGPAVTLPAIVKAKNTKSPK